jgi:hypothetical protein
MQTQQTAVQTRVGDGPFPPEPDSGSSAALDACRRLTDAADAAIDQAYSGDAEAFLNANRQTGGQ